jgi:hypothetical protein
VRPGWYPPTTRQSIALVLPFVDWHVRLKKQRDDSDD